MGQEEEPLVGRNCEVMLSGVTRWFWVIALIIRDMTDGVTTVFPAWDTGGQKAAFLKERRPGGRPTWWDRQTWQLKKKNQRKMYN